MNNMNSITTPEISFPKGGGAIKGMGEVVSSGYRGMASLSIPLPTSPARVLTPGLSLNYLSSSGNGIFGIGFSLGLPRISRSTKKGAPNYDDIFQFLGPNGDLLVTPDPIEKKTLQNKTFQVTRFYARLETAFDKIEYWQSGNGESFWWVFQGDGSQHIYGKTANARIAHQSDATKVFQWLLEESVATNGEHIYYEYKAETKPVLLDNLSEATREHTANRYIKRIHYANQTGFASLYLLSNKAIADIKWLFHVVFDYGEHMTDDEVIPSYQEKQLWLTRPDSFSDYSGGFEVRYHRLCRRVLMFHDFAELGSHPTLVSSLEIDYVQDKIMTRLEGVSICSYQAEEAHLKKSPLKKISGVPLEFNYRSFSFTKSQFKEFNEFKNLAGLNSGGFYQLVDLYGEGIPGILYRDGTSFFYRAPQRAENTDADNPDAISYSDWQPLPQVPTFGLGLANRQSLMDITGDGRLDLVSSLPGLSGFFSLDCSKKWHHFIPFSAFPTEFNHPRSYLADIMGAGLSDLILIGPNSVRLYANEREHGFAKPVEIAYGEAEPLPSAPPSPIEVIAFSDVLGSGQQHLIRIRHNEVVCWPNLGRGQFGKAIRLAGLPFARDEFNAERVFLVDIDGSGATDLLYVMSDRIKIFLNQSGNGFAQAYDLTFPDHIRYDNLTQLSFADVLGTGTACLVFTQTHPKVKHWIYAFNEGKKAYLMEQTNNNHGLNTRLIYRSSAQEWLDEKKDSSQPCSHLPFPIYVVTHIIHHDEITNNQLKQFFKYRQGYYDGKEREFRGFGYVQQYDCEKFSGANEKKDGLDFIPPVLTKTWYHVGNNQVQNNEYFYNGDSEAMLLNDILYWDSENRPLNNFEEATASELQRCLSGSIRRQEVFGLDGNDEKQPHPYTVTTFRYLVRLQREKAQGKYPSVFYSLLEQISYQYDRIPNDPRCDHLINLNFDPYGVITDSVAINYPRRGNFETVKQDPYFDEEQFKLRFNFTFLEVRHLDKDDFKWCLALPIQNQSRVNFFPVALPTQWQGPLSFEKLYENEYRQLEGEIIAWNQYRYWSPTEGGQGTSLDFGKVSCEGLIYQTLSAEIKVEEIRNILAEISKTELEQSLLIKKGKYQKKDGYYWIPSNIPHYASLKNFFRIESQNDPFDATTKYEYDPYSYQMIKLINALGYETHHEYDYRFLAPVKIVDPNEFVQEVFYDNQGRVRATTFYGQEDGKRVGFKDIQAFSDKEYSLEETIRRQEEPLNGMATLYFYDNFSWMGTKIQNLTENNEIINKCHELGLITTEGYFKHKAYWLTQEINHPDIEEILSNVTRLPCHSAAFVADSYEPGVTPLIRVTITYSDGFGRVLQNKQLVPPGKSYRADAGKGLAVEANKIVETNVEIRWAVSGRTEYNNKGLAIRQYQPYFIDTYEYINDDSLRHYAYSDRIYYDPLGRVIKQINAANFFQRNSYHPWYLKHEDENDTWAEALALQESETT